MNKPQIPEILQRFMNSFSDEEKNDLIEIEEEAQMVTAVLKDIAEKKRKENTKNVPKPQK